MTRVLIHGVLGRMGREVLNAVCREPDLEPTCGVDSEAAEGAIALPDGSGDMPISPDLSGIIARCRPQVMVDFTNAGAAMEASRVAAARGVNLGGRHHRELTEDNLKELDGLANEHQIGAFVAPNFALGAVLLIHLARGLGKYFDYADIVEMHHETKIDSPSGTAMALARSLGEDRDNPFHRPIAGEGACRGHPRRRPGGRVHSQRAYAGQDGPPRDHPGHCRSDPESETRHHQPRMLHARRCPGCQGSIELEGTGSGSGQAAWTLAFNV